MRHARQHAELGVFDLHTADHGYPSAEHGVAFTYDVAHAGSEGTVRLRSSDPGVRPSIDFAYFTDPDGYDERIMLDGVELVGELSPGAAVTDRASASEYVRRTAHTVYHPTGTCRMGAATDPTAVVDPELRVRGIDRLRVADASISPTRATVAPDLTCMMIDARAAEPLRA